MAFCIFICLQIKKSTLQNVHQPVKGPRVNIKGQELRQMNTAYPVYKRLAAMQFQFIINMYLIH